MMGRAVRASLIAACAGLIGASVPPPPADDPTPHSARHLLEQALRLRFPEATTAQLDLVIRNRNGTERRRLFQVMMKRIDHRIHAVGRITEPEYLRGMAIMTIENPDRSSDAFVYLPSIGRARRITSAHRGDAFLGSDLTYDDLGPMPVTDYEVTYAGAVKSGGERARLIRASSVARVNHDHIDFIVAESDLAILEARYFKREDEEPYRSVETPREWIRKGEGYALPTYVRIHNRLRQTTTEVWVRDLTINPSIDDREFSLLSLEHGAPSGTDPPR